MPLQSMTGYGSGQASTSTVAVTVELRSVNNRFRDLQLRCPREYMALEPRINKMLKEPFARGRIDAFVRRQAGPNQTRVVADVHLANDYARVINELTQEMVGVVTREVPFNFILQQPGVLTVRDAPVDVMAEWDVVETALTSAIADLKTMRTTEGEALHADLSGYLQELSDFVGQVEAASAGINERLRTRLETRIRRMLGDRFEAQRITQEAAVLADKADVAEEISRLRSHCNQFNSALEGNKPVGRRLDFLLQEMNREVNTIGSKAAEHPVSHRVVDMKAVLERMREQAANVE